ncbi:hypothetical protein BDV19DRAFT_398904 [Aspergillus venezuelensis]
MASAPAPVQTATPPPLIATRPNQNKPADKTTTPVKFYHDILLSADVGAWISSILALGLGAAVVAKARPGPLRSSAATLQFILFFLSVLKPASATDARPQKRATYILTLTTIMFASAFPIMFIFANYEDTYKVIDLDKRARKRAVLNIFQGAVSALENISRACGAFGGSAFLCALVQWYYTIRLYKGGFLPDNIEEAFSEGS